MTDASDEPRSAASEPSRLSTLIEIWFAANFCGHPAMRDTETFNHVRRAVDQLKQRLEQESA